VATIRAGQTAADAHAQLAFHLHDAIDIVAERVRLQGHKKLVPTIRAESEVQEKAGLAAIARMA
jgi:hypothetical protein